MRSLFRSLFVVLVALWAVSSAMAQGRATVFGTVTDPTGAVVSGAKVTLINTGTRQEQVTTSSDNGTYNIPSVVPGSYRISVTAAGFQTYVANQIDIQVDENRNISVTMTLGELSQQVVVSDAGAAQVDTRSATITEVVDSSRVTELPLNGRNPLDLQALVAGAGGSAAGGGGQAENNVIAINGNRQNANNYTLDGADNEDPFFNSPSVTPNPDALDQFSMKTSNYGVQEGRNAGAQMNAVIKSGTNQFHGSLFEYLRNQVMDASGYFAKNRPPYKRNQFGGSIGGPLWRDRLFVFFSYQGTRQSSTPNAVTTTVPSAAERAGNFAELCPAGFVAGICSSTASGNKQLKIPGGGNAPNNDLSAYVSPITTAFMNAFVPAPNSANNIYSYSPASKVIEDQYIGKIDANIDQKDTLSGHLVYVTNKTTQEPNNNNLPGFLAQIDYQNWHVAVNETHTFSDHLTNLFTFGFNEIARNQLPIIPQQLSWTDFGSGLVRAVATAPIGYDTTASGYFSALSRWPLNQYRASYQFSDLLNWTRGNHNFSLGGDIRQEYTDQSQTFQTDGSLTFSANYTGDQLGDFIVGRPNQIKQQGENGGKPARLSPDLFLNDDWKIERHLTLNLGLRWEPFVPMHDRLNRLVQFRPGQQSSVFPLAPVGYVFPGDPGVPLNTYSGKWAVFSPRVGFAWDIFGDGKTSLRGAFGIYNGNIRTQALNNTSSNVPYSQQVTLAQPSGGLVNPYAGLGFTPFPYTPPTPDQYSAYTFPVPLSINDFDPNFRQSRVTQWNLNIQQQLPWQVISTIAYVGTNGEHLFTQGEFNPAVYNKPGSTVDARRVYAPNYSNITRMFSNGHSTYHSLQATLNKRLGRGVTVLSNYTWSKSLDNGSADGNNFFNPFNYSASRGPSDYDLRHSFVTSFIWKIQGPGKGRSLLLRSVAGGWSVNGIIKVSSGSPFTVNSGVDNSKSGVNADQADRIKPILYYKNASKASQVAKYFDTSAFQPNAPGTFGNSGRNTMTGPGYSDFDFAFQKALPTPESFKLIFRAEAFNLFNHTSLGNPASTQSAATFGKISGQQGGPRVIQVALRAEF